VATAGPAVRPGESHRRGWTYNGSLMSPGPHDREDFRRGFTRWARSVRRWLAARAALAGLTAGMLLAGAGAAVAWWMRWGDLLPWIALLGAGGALLGLGIALGRRWSDGDVALYLDARLGGEEAISTAVELDRRAAAASPGAQEGAATGGDRAARLLHGATRRAVRPRLFRRVHGLALVGGGVVAWLSLVPLPAAPAAAPPPPGSEIVKVEQLQGLEPLTGVDRLDPRDAAQRARLEEIARRARELRADLARGLPKREAQARLAELRDAVSQERLRLGDARNRPGLDAAVRKLAADPRLARAAEALGAGDLTEFDQQMQRLANQAEDEARHAAKTALEEAAKAARERGAAPLADALERQRQEFAEREDRAEALRELARELGDALGDEARRDLEEFSERGDPEAQRRLAEALEEALQGLSDEERKRLAERLAKRLAQDENIRPLTREQLDELRRGLESREGREALREHLKELANQDPSGDAERERGLGEAERGGADAERELGLMPIPGPGGSGADQPAPGSGSPGHGRPGQELDRGQDGRGGPGSHHDEGTGDHRGETQRVPGGELRAKANAHLDPTAPLHRSTEGRGQARAGETANQQGTGVLGSVGEAELDAVERSEIPEEYRDQVGRYFRP